jgi:hypothetical protein
MSRSLLLFNSTVVKEARIAVILDTLLPHCNYIQETEETHMDIYGYVAMHILLKNSLPSESLSPRDHIISASVQCSTRASSSPTSPISHSLRILLSHSVQCTTVLEPLDLSLIESM